MDSTLHWINTAFDGFLAFLPNLVAGLVILLLGYIVAKVLGGLTSRLAKRLGFERLVARMGLGNPDQHARGSEWLGRAVTIVVMVVAVLQSFRAWRLDSAAVGLAEIVAYLPHVIGAAFILGVALYAGNWVHARLLRRDGERVGPMRLLPRAVRAGIVTFGGFMALRELQIAPEIVNIAFIIMLGAVGVAIAIAFGLGGRDVASKIAASWYERRNTVGPTSVRSSDLRAPAE